MIGRIRHGWTKPENADRNERLLKEEIFPRIADKNVPSYKGIQLFRRPIENEEVEFVTIMWFDSWEAVKRFSGEDYERAYVPPKAREVLASSTSARSTTKSGNVSTTSNPFRLSRRYSESRLVEHNARRSDVSPKANLRILKPDLPAADVTLGMAAAS
jgi:hypothetical protein